nr:Dihydroorotase [Klebsiella pneumoniae]
MFTAAKLYPANATTNSSHGVTSTDAIMPVLERMENWGCRCSFTAKSLTPRLIFSIVKRALLRR